MSATPKLLEAVSRYCDGGLSLVPTGRDKKPVCAWKGQQTTRDTREQILRKMKRSGVYGVAVVGGKVSGGVEIIDFDEPGFYEAWRDAVGELADGLPVQQTQSGMFQVGLRSDAPQGNAALAWIEDDTQEDGRRIAIETRGEGGYAVLPESQGPIGVYRTISGDFAAIPHISTARRNALLDAARKLCCCPFTKKQREAQERAAAAIPPKRRAAVDGDEPNVIDKFNESVSIRDALTNAGYSAWGVNRYTRPGEGASPGGVHVFDNGKSFHHSTNDKLHDGHAHDAFDVFCEYEHGGDVGKAVRAAADKLGIKPKESEPRSAFQYRGAPLSDQFRATVLQTIQNEQKRQQAGNETPANPGENEVSLPLPPSEGWKPFPVETLPEPIRTFAIKAAAAIGCDVSYIALPLLVALASSIGNTRRIILKRGWTEPAILWGAIIGVSGTTKSPALDAVLKYLFKLQGEALKRHAEAMELHQRELDEFEKQNAAWKRSKASEQPTPPTAPKAERYVVSDITIESIAPILQDNTRGVLVARDELAGWILGHNQYKGGQGSDGAHWLELHGGRCMVFDRKTGTQKTTYVPQASASVIGGIQPESLARCLQDAHFEDGTAARLLLAFPPRKPKRWSEDEIDSDVEDSLAGIYQLLHTLRMGVDPQTQQPCSILIGMTPEGKEAWIDFYNSHAQEQAQLTGDLSAAWSKLEGYAARFALVIHFIRWAAGDASLINPDAIDADSIKAGATLSAWFGNEAKRVYGVLAESEESKERRELIEIVVKRSGRITACDLMKASRRYRSSVDVAEAALEVLVKLKLGEWVPIGGGKSGRPTREFHLLDAGNGNETLKTPGNSGVSLPANPPIGGAA